MRLVGLWLGLAAAGCGDGFAPLVVDGAAGGDTTTTTSSSAGGVTGAGGDTAGGGGQGATTTTGSGGGGSQPGTEDCLDGVDNDDDGAVDCSDSDCQEYRCIEAPLPSGWEGPVVAATGVPPAACGGRWSQQGPTGGVKPNIAPVTCTGCSCDSPKGLSCPTQAWAGVYAAPQCQGIASTVFYGSCTAAGYAPQSLKLYKTAATGGGCSASGGKLSSKPAPYFGQQAQLCGAELGGGCSSGVCVPPAPEQGFAGALCIYRSGYQECPPAYPAFTVLASGFGADTRDCGACACSGPTGAKCSPVAELKSDMCAADIGNYTANDGCYDLVNLNLASKTALSMASPGQPQGGSCASSGGGSHGTVELKDPITVCCEQ